MDGDPGKWESRAGERKMLVKTLSASKLPLGHLELSFTGKAQGRLQSKHFTVIPPKGAGSSGVFTPRLLSYFG